MKPNGSFCVLKGMFAVNSSDFADIEAASDDRGTKLRVSNKAVGHR